MIVGAASLAYVDIGAAKDAVSGLQRAGGRAPLSGCAVEMTGMDWVKRPVLRLRKLEQHGNVQPAGVPQLLKLKTITCLSLKYSVDNWNKDEHSLSVPVI